MKPTLQRTGSGLTKLSGRLDDYCLIILDIMLPGMDGFQVLSEIRALCTVPVLMLTAKSDETDKVTGLRMGADDYLTKPFSLNELTARMESLIRRYTTFNPFAPSGMLIFKNLTIDPDSRNILRDDQAVSLSGREFDLLFFLASHAGRVFTKKQIYREVWNTEYTYDDGNLMSFISKLRKKIEPDPDRPLYILTVHNVGYCFNREV